MLSRALTTGAVSTLLAQGIGPEHFLNNADGQECAEVFLWATTHTRKFNVSPSQALLRERFPTWRGEGSSDPLEALIETFKSHVKRRAFSAKVIELAKAEADPSEWHRLDEILLNAARDLSAIVPSGSIGRLSEMQQRVDQYEEEVREGYKPGFKLGVPAFDDLIEGVRPGEVLTISGFLNLGKSLISQWVALNAVEQDRTALLLSLEMSKREVFERFDAMVMNFSHRLLRGRQLPEREIIGWRRIAAQFKNIEHDLFVIDGLGGCTMERVYAEINRYKPDVTVVDYVQLMKSTISGQKQWEMLHDVTNQMKSIAVATQSSIIMVSQDNRSASTGGSTLDSMGGSISIGQAADLYIGMEQTEEMRAEKKMIIKLLKNRNGPRDRSAELLWEPEFMRFGPWQEGHAHKAFMKAA